MVSLQVKRSSRPYVAEENEEDTSLKKRLLSPQDTTPIVVHNRIRTPSPPSKRSPSSSSEVRPASPTLIRAETPRNKLVITREKKAAVETPIKSKPVAKEATVESPTTRSKRELVASSERRRLTQPSRSVVEQPTAKVSRVIALSEPSEKEPVAKSPVVSRRAAAKMAEEEEESTPLKVKQHPSVVVPSRSTQIAASPVGLTKEKAKPVTPVGESAAGTGKKPNYAAMSEKEQERYMSEFEVKLRILRRSFKEHSFADFPAEASLDRIHDIYSDYVKGVVVSLNCNQWRIYLVIMFLGIEAFGTRVLGLNMTGFTLSQLAVMSRYDPILVEIGEKHYVEGTSTWSPEARLAFMGFTSALTFLFVKYLSNYIGGEAAMIPIQRAIDSLLAGGGSAAGALPAGVPAPPREGEAPTPEPSAAPSPPGAGLDLMGMLGGLLGGQAGAGGGGGIADLIAKVGSSIIGAGNGAATVPNPTVAANAPPAGSAPRRRPKFRAPSSNKGVTIQVEEEQS